MTEPAADLAPDALAAVLGDRPVQTYPTVLSTEPLAMAWARRGAPAGAVVVADYQASPRGRGGWPWRVSPGVGLGCSVVLRPDLPPEREGWLYVAAAAAVADVTDDPAARIDWPDTVRSGEQVSGRLGAFVQLGPARTEWAVLTALLEAARPPRAALLARFAQRLEERVAGEPGAVLADYLPRCATLGGRWRARMIPLGPGGPVVSGTAVDVLADGALVLLTARGNRVAVRPQHLGLLEPAED